MIVKPSRETKRNVLRVRMSDEMRRDLELEAARRSRATGVDGSVRVPDVIRLAVDQLLSAPATPRSA